MKLEIVMFNMSSYVEWQKGIPNRNSNVFNKLLKNPEVGRIIAVDFLPFSFKRVLRNYWQNIVKKLKIHPIKSCEAGISPKAKLFNRVKNQKSKITNIYRDLTTKCVEIKGYQTELYVFSTIDSIFSHRLVIKKLNKVLKIINNQSTINNQQSTIRVLWSYFPMFVDYFEHTNSAPPRSLRSHFGNANAPMRIGIKADLKVFDTVDNWIEHPSFVKHKERLKNNYQIIAQKSDLIFTVSKNLIDFFHDLGRDEDVFWIPNGVDVNHFSKSKFETPKDLQKIPQPIIGYVGVIQQRADLDLLEYLAEKNPDKSFVLIGPLWPVYFRKLRRPAIEIKKLKKYKNIYLLGRKPYQISPAYIKNFDVAISPHRLDAFIKYTNSLKVLEYLACGRPVVTTPPSGVERFSHLIYIAQDYQDFNKKLNQAIKDDSTELREKRIENMKEQDWGLRIKRMINLIKDKLA
ncbi:glycosyltransferase [Patescibacteria group bacterium]|nr:glycosyltransferase [Patescibacteria group bacterium]